jgi:hypothetical protein
MSTKFTPEVQAVIVEALLENPSIYSAAAKADVTYQTVMLWLQKGDEGAEGYAEFAQACAVARSQMKNEIVQSLYEIACDRLHPQAVRAARELLSSLYPKEFSSVRHVISHQAKPADDLDVSKIPTAELRAFLKTLKRIRAEEPKEPSVMLVDAIEIPGGKPSPKGQKL